MFLSSPASFGVAVAAVASVVAVADQALLPPAVREGAQLALVRDFGAVESTGEGWRAEGAFVDVDASGGGALLADGRGRVLVERILLPAGTLRDAPRFEPVGWWERALLTAEGPTARLLVLNAATSGLAIQARVPIRVTFALAPGTVAEAMDARTVVLHGDGPDYTLRLAHGHGALTVEEASVRALLAEGADVHGWLDGAPATLAVQELQFGRKAWSSR